MGYVYLGNCVREHSVTFIICTECLIIELEGCTSLYILYVFFYSYTYGKGVEGSVHVKTSLVGKHRPAFLVDKPEVQQVEFDKPLSPLAFFNFLIFLLSFIASFFRSIQWERQQKEIVICSYRNYKPDSFLT